MFQTLHEISKNIIFVFVWKYVWKYVNINVSDITWNFFCLFFCFFCFFLFFVFFVFFLFLFFYVFFFFCFFFVFFLKCLVIFISEAIWSWTFLHWEVFVYWFNLLASNSFRVSISSWFSLGRLYVSRNLSISSRFSHLLVYNCL